MSESERTAPDGIEINISADRMSAKLNVAQAVVVSASAVIEKLREMKISGFDDARMIQAVEKRKDEAISIEVATGVAPVEDRPEKFDFRLPFSNGRTCLPTKVEVGQVIAQITPAVAGTDGKDVFGNPIERHKNEHAMQVGRNLSVAKGKLICDLKGNLRLNGNLLSVEPLLELRGDDGNVAPVVFDGDAHIRGSLPEGRSLQITGCLAVSGSVEAVQLNIGGSVHIQGGIIGKRKGSCNVGGDLTCRFISGGSILVSHDIHVQRDITESHLACGGRLQVAQGILFGGTVAASGGVDCSTLGHPGGAPTLIEAGAGAAVRAFAASANIQIAANKKRLAHVRKILEPLLKIMASLTAQQREKVAELQHEIDDFQAATTKLATNLENQNRSLNEKACAEVRVAKIAHPGVTIRFPHAQTTFTSSTKGPFTLIPHESDGVTKILLIDGSDQSRTILSSQPSPTHTEASSVSMTEARAA